MESRQVPGELIGEGYDTRRKESLLLFFSFFQVMLHLSGLCMSIFGVTPLWGLSSASSFFPHQRLGALDVYI